MRRPTMRTLAGALAAAALAGCVPHEASSPDAITGTVSSVHDGDTITVGGVRVRVLGIDAPEISHDGRPAECGGDAARAALNDLVWRRTVTVTPDPRSARQDRFGRVLGYVTLGSVDVGRAQVAGGWASAWYPKDAAEPTRYGAYRGDEATAKANHTGNWASCATQGRRGRR